MARSGRCWTIRGFGAHADDLGDQARDVVGDVGAVGVVDDGAGGAVLMRYWSMIHSRAARLPRRSLKAAGGMRSRVGV